MTWAPLVASVQSCPQSVRRKQAKQAIARVSWNPPGASQGNTHTSAQSCLCSALHNAERHQVLRSCPLLAARQGSSCQAAAVVQKSALSAMMEARMAAPLNARSCLCGWASTLSFSRCVVSAEPCTAGQLLIQGAQCISATCTGSPSAVGRGRAGHAAVSPADLEACSCRRSATRARTKLVCCLCPCPGQRIACSEWRLWGQKEQPSPTWIAAKTRSDNPGLSLDTSAGENRASGTVKRAAPTLTLRPSGSV